MYMHMLLDARCAGGVQERQCSWGYSGGEWSETLSGSSSTHCLLQTQEKMSR